MAKKDEGVAVNTSKLREAVSVVSKMTGLNGTVVLNVNKGSFDVTAGNIVGSAAASFDLDDEAAVFSCALNGDALGRVIKEFRVPEVRLHAGGVLRAGKSQLRLKEQTSTFGQVGEAPTMPVEVKREDLLACIEAVRYAVSTDNARPHISCIAIEITERTMSAVATNGHRLARRTIKHKSKHELKALLPRDAVAALLKMLDAATDDKVTVGIEHDRASEIGGASNCLAFEVHEPFNVLLQFRTQSFSEYPPVAGFFHGEIDGTKVNCDVLRAAVMRASLIGGPVVLECGPEGLAVSVTAERGDAVEKIDVAGKAFEGMRAFSPAYLLDAVSHASKKSTLEMDFGEGSFEPMRMIDDDGYEAIVMPVRI